MFASSINLKIKFVTLAFIDARKARPFDCAYMHKSVRLAIIANQETKTFGCIEEFDSARGFFAGQFTLWRARLRNGNNVTDNLKVLCRNLPAAIDKVEFEFLTFGKTLKASPFNCADVHEHILTASFLLDEAEAFLCVEKFNGALAGTNHLRRHPTCATRSGAAATGTAAEAASVAAAVTAKTITAAKAAPVRAAAVGAVALLATKAPAVVPVTGR